MTFERYLSFMLCVILTLLVLLLLGLLIRLGWEGLIVPIMDKIKEHRDTYYIDQYNDMEKQYKELERRLYRIGFDKDFVDCIDPCCGPKISKEYKDETTRSGCINVMVKFSMLESEYTKTKEEQQKIFKV